MIYFEDLNMISKYGNEVILRHCEALDDGYYRIDSKEKYYEDYHGNPFDIIDSTICSADTLEAAKIYCDLHDLKIVETIEECD